ncbi:hypothetical protein ACS0PU_005798 [Formica fusca]
MYAFCACVVGTGLAAHICDCRVFRDSHFLLLRTRKENITKHLYSVVHCIGYSTHSVNISKVYSLYFVAASASILSNTYIWDSTNRFT